MRLNTAKQTILIVSIFSVAILGIIGGIILPTIKYIKHLNNETANLKNYLEKKYQNTISLRSSIKKMEDIQITVNHYQQHFFYAGDELKLITILENLAIKNNIVQKIESSNLDQNNRETIKITLTLYGEYSLILQYLSDLEQINFFINIDRAQLSATGKKTSVDFSSSTPTNLYLELSLYETKK